MKNSIFSIAIFLISTLNIQAQWTLVGKVSTSSQFELTITGKPLLSMDSTKIFFVNGGVFSTYDIQTNTLTNVIREFVIGDGDGAIIDNKRNRIISIKNDGLKSYDYVTKELIYESQIGIEGTLPAGLFIDKERDELIIIHRGYESNGAVSIYDLENYNKKHDFITNYRIETIGYVILDEARSNLYLFYADPDSFEVFSLDSYQIVYSSAIQSYYGSPYPIIDYKNDRIILCDYFEHYKNTLINLNDYSIQYVESNFWGYQISVDTISDRIWNGNMNTINGHDLKTLEIIDVTEAPSNYVIHSPFACPKFNYLYGLSGNYLLIFDLKTFAYLGKVKVGSSPEGIVIDHLNNTIYSKEGMNPEFTLFSDFRLKDVPQMIKNIELDDNSIGFRGFDIIPDRKEIVYAGDAKISLYNYMTNDFKSFPLEWAKSVKIDIQNQRVFVGQSRDGPGETPINRLFVFDLNLNPLWNLVVPLVNADLEYDKSKYLYYHSRKTWYYPGLNKIYKIDADSKAIVDSIRIGYEIAKIEYSKNHNRLYALNSQTDSFPGRLYILDCNDMTCIDSVDIPGARIGFLADTLSTLFIISSADGTTEITKLICFDINSNIVVSEQYMPDKANPIAININPVTNTLYIVDQTFGGVYKYRNDAFPGPPPPNPPSPPLLIIGDNQIELKWERNDAIPAYNLYRKKANEEWMSITFQPIVDTFYKDLNLVNNIEYSYALSLLAKYNIEGEKSVTVKGIPIDLPDFEMSRIYSDNICSNDGKDALFTFGIKEEALFNDSIAFSFDNMPPGISTSSVLKTFEEDILSVKLESDGSTKKGNYTVTLIASGGGQTHAIDFSLNVYDQINVTIDYNPKDLQVGEWISIEGSIYPLFSKPLVINILSTKNETAKQDTVYTDENGVFKNEYIALTSDTLRVWANMINYSNKSDTLLIYIRPGDVSVSCIADVSDSTGIGWNVQVTGRVFPNPGSGTVKLQITSPYDTIYIVENIPLNEFGYYGHSFSPDTSGLWKINAFYSGNDNYATATSYPNFVPIKIKSGYSIIFVGDVSSESSSLDTTFRNLGKYAYNVLLDRHLGKEDIFVIFPDANSDLDGNSKSDDVDGTSDINSLKAAFEWAKTNVLDSLDLTLFLVSKGDTEKFMVNDIENLPVDSLNKWFSDFSLSENNSKINIIVENSYGATYISKLAGQNRRIITSTSDTVAYFFNYGDLSFSGYFWNYISLGASIGESFIVSKSVLNTFPDVFFGQECLIDANYNQLTNEQEDYQSTSELFIGYGTLIDNFAPEILGSTIDTDNNFKGFTKVKSTFTKGEVKEGNLYLSILINSPAENLDKVYAILIKNDSKSEYIFKSNNQLPDYKVFELIKFSNTNYYISRVDEFFDIGNYTFIVYASDNSGLKAIPKYSQFSIVEIAHSIQDTVAGIDNFIKVYPNPFSSHMTLEYILLLESEIVIKLYNISGAMVDILDQGKKNPGIYSSDYDNNLDPGIYFISFEAKNILNNSRSRTTRKIICIK